MRTNKSLMVCACCALLIAPVAIRSSLVKGDESKNSNPSFRVEDLFWLAGDWRSDHEGDLLQEIWSEPIADSMMGSFRWIKGGKTWMYELFTVTQTNDGVTFRLKHFTNQLVGWEDKDECLDLALVKLDGNLVIFEHPKRNNLKRLTYTRTTDDTMVARVEGLDKQGRPEWFEINFNRRGK